MATHPTVEADRIAALKIVRGGYSAALLPPRHSGSRPLRRRIGREQGRALETLGHAVDYLCASYLQNGSDHAILDFRGPEMDAVRLLIDVRRELLASLPLIEPLMVRLWHGLRRHGTPFKSSAVVP